MGCGCRFLEVASSLLCVRKRGTFTLMQWDCGLGILDFSRGRHLIKMAE